MKMEARYTRYIDEGKRLGETGYLPWTGHGLVILDLHAERFGMPWQRPVSQESKDEWMIAEITSHKLSVVPQAHQPLLS